MALHHGVAPAAGRRAAGPRPALTASRPGQLQGGRACRPAAAAAASSAPARGDTPAAADVQQAQAAFNAHLQSLLSASGSDVCVEALASLTLSRSSRQRLLSRSPAPHAWGGDDAAAALPLPLSQLAFKALLRGSLAAARLDHGYTTTPHLVLGLVAAGAPALATVDYAAAEGAVTVLVDGGAPGPQRRVGVRAAAAEAGLGLVSWCELSGRAAGVLAAAEELRCARGDALLTSAHLLAALLDEPASSSEQQQQAQQPWASRLLAALGLESCDVAAAAAAQLQAQQAGAGAAGGGVPAEDGAVAAPTGYLHEGVASSLARSLRPVAASADVVLN